MELINFLNEIESPFQIIGIIINIYFVWLVYQLNKKDSNLKISFDIKQNGSEISDSEYFKLLEKLDSNVNITRREEKILEKKELLERERSEEYLFRDTYYEIYPYFATRGFPGE